MVNTYLVQDVFQGCILKTYPTFDLMQCITQCITLPYRFGGKGLSYAEITVYKTTKESTVHTVLHHCYLARYITQRPLVYLSLSTPHTDCIDIHLPAVKTPTLSISEVRTSHYMGPLLLL